MSLKKSYFYLKISLKNRFLRLKNQFFISKFTQKRYFLLKNRLMSPNFASKIVLLTKNFTQKSIDALKRRSKIDFWVSKIDILYPKIHSKTTFFAQKLIDELEIRFNKHKKFSKSGKTVSPQVLFSVTGTLVIGVPPILSKTQSISEGK